MVCKKCLLNKETSFFYKNKTTFGFFTSCKKCINERAIKRYKFLEQNDPNFIEKEKQRKRDKTKLLRDLGLKRKRPKLENTRIISKKYLQKFPEKHIARSILSEKGLKKGFHRHHWSYNKEHACDIIYLTNINHNKLHRYIIYDQERFMYRRIDTMELLDTKEKHFDFYKSLIDKP